MSMIIVITFLFCFPLQHTDLLLSSQCTNPSPIMHVFVVGGWVGGGGVRGRENVCVSVCV